MSLSAEVRSWRVRRLERPLPLVEVGHGPAVPGAVLRVAGLVLAALLLLGAASRVVPGLRGLVWLVGGVCLVWLALSHRRGPAVAILCLAAVTLLASPAAPFDPVVWWMAPLGHLVLRTAWWAEQVPAGARVELAALRRTGARDVVVLAACLAVGVLAALLAGAASAPLVLLGAVALVVLVVALLRR